MTKPSSPMRRVFLRFLLAVAAVHVVAITGYYMLDVASSSASRQRWYAWTWMGVTVAVVLIGVQRLKRARRRSSTASG